MYEDDRVGATKGKVGNRCCKDICYCSAALLILKLSLISLFLVPFSAALTPIFL